MAASDKEIARSVCLIGSIDYCYMSTSHIYYVAYFAF